MNEPPVTRLAGEPKGLLREDALRLAVEPKGLPQQVLRELEKPLDWSRVRKKPGPGNFDYLPHDDVTRTANRIFGYDGWGYTTDEVTCVSQGPFSREGRQGYLAAYTARVTLRVRLQDGTWLLRGGTGEGFHMEYSEIAQAVVHGKAAKAAESDALKRAFMRFGDQFGLILYAEEGERAALQAEAEARRGRPLAPGDRPAREEEIEELLSLARRLDEARGTQDLAEKVARASLEEHRARTEDGVVSADWLRRQITRLIELLAQVERPQTTVERPEPRFRPPDSVQEEMAAVDEADIEAAFSSAFREEAA